jgi:hypothetical protein
MLLYYIIFEGKIGLGDCGICKAGYAVKSSKTRSGCGSTTLLAVSKEHLIKE